tara:strand:+ start:298 stop:492 length:195 start_codon:yes stop_codon:yes gene_type:complete
MWAKPTQKDLDNMPNMVKCKKCKKNLSQLDLFSGDVCVDCYEKQYNKNLKKSGIMPSPDFKNIY